MPERLNIMMGQITYIGENANEKLITDALKPKDTDSFTKISVVLKHEKPKGHIIDIYVEKGFMKKGSDEKILTIESMSQFSVAPYDDDFFKKPAKVPLVKMIAEMAQKASDHNLGMFVIVREEYGLNEALPRPIPNETLKDMIFNDVNRQLLS